MFFVLNVKLRCWYAFGMSQENSNKAEYGMGRYDQVRKKNALSDYLLKIRFST